MEELAPKSITIAITVYDRRTYLGGAIQSALSQTTPEKPHVIVVEDCGPDTTLRQSVVSEFDHGIQYQRNSKRRGLCGNWNACIEACRTQWLCILHDDDLLEPTFTEAMVELAQAAPGGALYYGLCDVVDDSGCYLTTQPRPNSFAWHALDMKDWASYDPVCFPGQLFNVEAARTLGGFRAESRYTADWEMWFKLALSYGAAATNRVVARYRDHYSIGRGTTEADISGRRYAYVNVQRKRHTAWLRRSDSSLRFDRVATQKKWPMSTRFILQHGLKFSARMLRYNAGLLLVSSAPHLRYRVFQIMTRLLTWRSLRIFSVLFQPGNQSNGRSI
jgi:glycosyltransferase involved in cell wall biosynthesis